MNSRQSSFQPIQPLKRSVWDYLFYACMTIIMVWLILKMTGVIKTPIWLEYGVPIGSFVIGFLVFYQSLFDKLLALYGEIGKLHANDARIDEKLVHIDRDIETIKRVVRT